MKDERYADADRLFDAALDREPHERAAFVRAACAGDQELQRAVESLLENDRDAGRFLQTPALELMAERYPAPHGTSMIGRELAGYHVVDLVGAGGMGEVYRARDSKLGRDVAIKVLPHALASDADRLARLEREARMLAALNHPHIASIYGLEESDAGPALVLEFVEGPTLADRLTTGPFLVAEALAIARQIADALDAAHEKGIVHRDLKPGNIKIRGDGTVKVLDFGLAKIVSPESGKTVHQDLSHSPTMVMAATEAGMILGTAAYMAPEQARGNPVDKRADVWAFGVVVYEMLTGRRPFEGEDQSSILAAVIQSEPRWDGVPATVRRMLESCLEKDPRKRLRDIGDVWKLLDDAPGVPLRSRTGTIGWMAASLLAVVAAIALWAPWRFASPPTAQPVLRLEAALGSGVSLEPLAIPTFSSVVISPDGTRLVYVGSVSGGPPKLLTRRLDQDQPNVTELTGTEGAMNPFFSRDGQWVGFWSGRTIFKVPVEGGGAVPLGELPAMTGGDWDDDNNLIIGTGAPSSAGVLRMPPTGGAATPMLELASGELFHAHPQILPGGKALLVEVVGTPPSQDNFTIDVVSIPDRRRKTLVRGVGSPRYVASGHLLYTKGTTMFAVPFDLERLETRGAAVQVLDDVAYDPIASGAQYDVSRSGTLVYRRSSGVAIPMSTVHWIDSTGKQEPLLAKPGAYVGTPRVSPDGKRIAIAVRDGANQDIWVYEPLRDAMTRLTLGGGTFANPIWSFDGRHVIFGSMGSGLRWGRADGAGQLQVLQASKSIQLPSSITQAGTRLAYFQPDGNPQIWSVPIEADAGGVQAGTPERFLTTKVSDLDPAFSPDGRWLAYSSNESGKFEVYVRAFTARATAGSERWLVSNSGGGAPAWLPKSRELLYQAGDQIMAVGYTVSGDTFIAGKPRVWAASVRAASGFDVAPDGSRVAALMPVTPRDAAEQEHSVVFVMNFFDELRRRVPIGP